MNDLDKTMRVYLLSTELVYRIRTGWDDDHWNVQAVRRESIAEHVYAVIMLAISISSTLKVKVNLERVILMLAIHEIGEVLCGDITPFDGITPEEKARIEHKAMFMMLDGLTTQDELYALLLEFDKHETPDAKFAYYCDKLQANIQSKWYQDHGFQNELSNQENNVAFKSKKCQAILREGAHTVFDIWYKNDITLFEGNPIFTSLMDWLKENDLYLFEKNDKTHSNYENWLANNNYG